MANKKMNINVTINGITENEINVLNAMFGDRITITVEEPKKGRKSAPTKPNNDMKSGLITVENGMAVGKDVEPKKTTRREAIAQWKIEKYGSAEKAEAVQKMADVVAKEWADIARKTGKYVVKKSQYKDKLYEEALKRVNAEDEKAKTTKKATKKR